MPLVVRSVVGPEADSTFGRAVIRFGAVVPDTMSPPDSRRAQIGERPKVPTRMTDRSLIVRSVEVNADGQFAAVTQSQG